MAWTWLLILTSLWLVACDRIGDGQGPVRSIVGAVIIVLLAAGATWGVLQYRRVARRKDRRDDRE